MFRRAMCRSEELYRLNNEIFQKKTLRKSLHKLILFENKKFARNIH